MNGIAYWKDLARREKARADLEEHRKGNWIMISFGLGLVVLVVIGPSVDAVIGENVDQIGWDITIGVGLMLLITIWIGLTKKRGN